MFDVNPNEAHGMNAVAKSPKKSQKKQYGIKLLPADSARVEDTARGLNLDETSFLRMIITENLPRYERRVANIRAGNDPDEKPDTTS